MVVVAILLLVGLFVAAMVVYFSGMVSGLPKLYKKLKDDDFDFDQVKKKHCTDEDHPIYQAISDDYESNEKDQLEELYEDDDTFLFNLDKLKTRCNELLNTNSSTPLPYSPSPSSSPSPSPNSSTPSPPPSSSPSPSPSSPAVPCKQGSFFIGTCESGTTCDKLPFQTEFTCMSDEDKQLMCNSEANYVWTNGTCEAVVSTPTIPTILQGQECGASIPGDCVSGTACDILPFQSVFKCMSVQDKQSVCNSETDYEWESGSGTCVSTDDTYDKYPNKKPSSFYPNFTPYGDPYTNIHYADIGANEPETLPDFWDASTCETQGMIECDADSDCDGFFFIQTNGVGGCYGMRKHTYRENTDYPNILIENVGSNVWIKKG